MAEVATEARMMSTGSIGSEYSSNYELIGFNQVVYPLSKVSMMATRLNTTIPLEYAKTLEKTLVSLNDSYHTKSVESELDARLKELDALEDEYEDKRLYRKTKKLLVQIIKLLHREERPLVGARDSGQIEAQWCNVNGKDVLIVPYSKAKISISTVSDDFDVSARNISLDAIKRDGIAELD